MTTLRSLSRRFRNALSRTLWRWTKPTRKATGQIAADIEDLRILIARAKKGRRSYKHMYEAMRKLRIEQMREAR